MDVLQVLGLAGVAALLAMSPGPNGVLIAKTVPTSGRKAGFANVAGFVAAFYLHGTLSIFGISIILLRSAEAFFVVKAPGRGAFVLVTVHALLNLVWFSAMVLLFARVMQAARSGRFQRWLKAVTGVIFMGFGAKLAALDP